MNILDDCFRWLFRMTVPDDYSGCLFQMTVPDDCLEWLFRMTVPDEYFGWLFRMLISDDYDCSGWLFQMPISDDYFEWQFRIPISDDFSEWLFVIQQLIRILATNSYFHGRFLFQPIIRLIGPTTDSFLSDGFLLQIMTLTPLIRIFQNKFVVSKRS